jgi:hypothetical protein
LGISSSTAEEAHLLAVKTGKPDRKRPQRVDSAAPARKTSRPPGLTSRSPSAASRPPATNSASGSRSSRPRPPPRPDSARPDLSRHHSTSQPEITLRRQVAGRDTLAAIADELSRDLPKKHRPKLDTLGYEDRPTTQARLEQESSPEVITIGEAPIGRATMAAIDEALAAEARAMMAEAERRGSAAEARHAASSPTTGFAGPRAGLSSMPVLEPAEIFEISTFIVEGDEIFSKASDASRRDFVEKRLLHRLPALSMEEVVRIDVSRGAAANTVILRIWSKVGHPPG